MIKLEASLERKKKIVDADEQIIEELRQKSKFKAHELQNRLPSLNEILYDMNEDKALTMEEVLYKHADNE
jgi:hypothetical protein